MAKTSPNPPAPISEEDEAQWQEWAKVRDELLADPATATEYAQAGRDLAAYEQLATASLAQFRRARALTQIQLAQLMGISQAEVSRVEHQSDLRLSTLASYIAAAGGRLIVGIEVQPGAPLIEMDIEALSAHQSPEATGLATTAGQIAYSAGAMRKAVGRQPRGLSEVGRRARTDTLRLASQAEGVARTATKLSEKAATASARAGEKATAAAAAKAEAATAQAAAASEKISSEAAKAARTAAKAAEIAARQAAKASEQAVKVAAQATEAALQASAKLTEASVRAAVYAAASAVAAATSR